MSAATQGFEQVLKAGSRPKVTNDFVASLTLEMGTQQLHEDFILAFELLIFVLDLREEFPGMSQLDLGLHGFLPLVGPVFERRDHVDQLFLFGFVLGRFVSELVF